MQIVSILRVTSLCEDFVVFICDLRVENSFCYLLILLTKIVMNEFRSYWMRIRRDSPISLVDICDE